MGDFAGEIIRFEDILTGRNIFVFDALPRLGNLQHCKINETLII